MMSVTSKVSDDAQVCVVLLMCEKTGQVLRLCFLIFTDIQSTFFQTVSSRLYLAVRRAGSCHSRTPVCKVSSL
jgi:hypothetical protein